MFFLRIRRKINFLLGRRNWSEDEYFLESWKGRIKVLASLLKDEASILDLGCGMQWLKEFIPDHIEYYPVDFKKRTSDIIVCDFNKKQFPNIKSDVAFISGCLEYVNDTSWFISEISKSCSTALCSYSSLEKFPDIKFRKTWMWVNHLTRDQVIDLFYSYGMELTAEGDFPGQEIFRFDKRQQTNNCWHKQIYI